MPALTTVAVTARTTSGCTLTLNAAAVDINATQIRQLQQLFTRLSLDTSGPAAANGSATITIAGQA